MNGAKAGLLWVQSLTHEVHDHKGGAVAHDVFTEPGGSGSADFVVDVEAASDDG